MQLKTILNRVQKHQSFIYTDREIYIMNTKIKALLLDLDGVVVFTDKYHYLAWKKLACEEGWKFDESINQELRGVSRLESLRIILRHNQLLFSDEKLNQLAEKKNAYYIDYLNNITEKDLYPGVIAFINKCKDYGAKVAICSSSRNANLVLERLNIKHLFDVVITGMDITKTKPDPQIFKLASEELCIHPSRCIVFEDAYSGIEAALAAGMKCLGVGRPEYLSNAPDTFEQYEKIEIDVLLGSGHKNVPPVNTWKITEEGFNQLKAGYWESLFALSNGYMGIRGTYDEADSNMSKYAKPGMFINSVYEYREQNIEFSPRGTPKRLHAMVNLLDWRIFDLIIEGEHFGPFEGKLIEHSRSLNMKSGVLERHLIWESPNGKRIKIETMRLVSMTRRHTAAIRISVTPLNFSGNIIITKKVSTATKTKIFDNWELRPQRIGNIKDMHYMLYQMPISKIQSLALFAHDVNIDRCFKENIAVAKTNLESDMLSTSWELDVEQDNKVTIDTFGVFYSSFDTDIKVKEEHDLDSNQMYEAMLNSALLDMQSNVQEGFNQLYNEQLNFWNHFWSESDIRIEGNDRDQQAVRFCLFHLMQGHPQDDRRSISANGLTGEEYRGLVFWDTEMYMLPFFLHFKPELARSLLMYRYNILDEARRHAREVDNSPGAFFSWSSITGEEWISVHHLTAGYHLNAAIGYAIWRYYLQTEDKDFLFGPGAELLFETARFLENLGGYVPLRENKFCINYVIGPDENSDCVNNNCYTNMMTKHHFEFAYKLYIDMQNNASEKLEALTEKIGLSSSEHEKWRRAAENMYIPYHQELGIHMQDDSFLYLTPVDMNKVGYYTDTRMGFIPLKLVH